MENKEYKISLKKHKGIDDLKLAYAFIGNSQGDETISNDVSYFIHCDGWLSVSSNYKDINYLIQENVDKRTKELNEYNDNYIENLKDSGEYNLEYIDEITFNMIDLPEFDGNNFINGLSSYEYKILDFGNVK